MLNLHKHKQISLYDIYEAVNIVTGLNIFDIWSLLK